MSWTRWPWAPVGMVFQRPTPFRAASRTPRGSSPRRRYLKTKHRPCNGWPWTGPARPSRAPCPAVSCTACGWPAPWSPSQRLCSWMSPLRAGRAPKRVFGSTAATCGAWNHIIWVHPTRFRPRRIATGSTICATVTEQRYRGGGNAMTDTVSWRACVSLLRVLSRPDFLVAASGLRGRSWLPPRARSSNCCWSLSRSLVLIPGRSIWWSWLWVAHGSLRRDGRPPPAPQRYRRAHPLAASFTAAP